MFNHFAISFSESNSVSNSTKPPRQSNLELFCIGVMLLIVVHHYVINSGLSGVMAAHPGTLRTLYYQLLGAWGKTGINCFICITAWFMCQSRISALKFAKLLAQIYFYKILLFAIFSWGGMRTSQFNGFLNYSPPLV